MEPFLNKIRDLIAKDQMPKAIAALRQLTAQTPLLNEAILQSSRYHDIERRARKGLLTSKEAAVASNQVRWGILELLKEIAADQASIVLPDLLVEIAQQGQGEAISQELEKAISVINSKNVLINAAIHAGGNVHVGDIIYHSEAAAGKATDDHPYNKQLTQHLISAIAPYVDNAKRLHDDQSWLEQAENLRKVQAFLCRNFAGEIAKQLRQLMAIGSDKNNTPDEKRDAYVHKCRDIVRRSFDLINFTLLSALWDVFQIAPRNLSREQKAVLRLRFDQPFEPSSSEQFALLQTLHGIFTEQQLTFPLPEVAQLQAELQPESSLQQCCVAIDQLDPKDPASGAAAEGLLSTFLGHVAFLVNYRMASIKRIQYHQQRLNEPQFVHRYIDLGIDNKANEDTEKINCIAVGEQTHAVLLYRGAGYQENTSLFPFVIDYNALTGEQGAKVCFYSATDLEDGSLEYRFLSDNSILRVEKTGIRKADTDLNELMMDPEKEKALHLDGVVHALQEARKCLLGDGLNFDNL